MDEELARLELAYSETVDAYSRILQRLGDVRSIGTKTEYDAACRATNEASELMASARLALDSYHSGSPS